MADPSRPPPSAPLYQTQPGYAPQYPGIVLQHLIKFDPILILHYSNTLVDLKTDLHSTICCM